jgi:hypothetical protein
LRLLVSGGGREALGAIGEDLDVAQAGGAQGLKPPVVGETLRHG